MLNEIQTGRYNAILGKLLGMKQTPAPLLATDIFPMLALEVDRPEWPFLAGVRLCGGYRSDAAVVGQYSHIALRNPTGSGILAVVTSWNAYATSTAYCYAGIRAQAGLDATAAGNARDGRWSTAGAFASKCELGDYTNAVAAPGAVVMAWPISASGQGLVTNVPIVLPQGFELMFSLNGNNNSLTASIQWYERPQLPSESR